MMRFSPTDVTMTSFQRCTDLQIFSTKVVLLLLYSSLLLNFRKYMCLYCISINVCDKDFTVQYSTV